MIFSDDDCPPGLPGAPLKDRRSHWYSILQPTGLVGVDLLRENRYSAS